MIVLAADHGGFHLKEEVKKQVADFRKVCLCGDAQLGNGIHLKGVGVALDGVDTVIRPSRRSEIHTVAFQFAVNTLLVLCAEQFPQFGDVVISNL